MDLQQATALTPLGDGRYAVDDSGRVTGVEAIDADDRR